MIEDVPRASKTLVNEFEAGIDPLYQYLRDTPVWHYYLVYIVALLMVHSQGCQEVSEIHYEESPQRHVYALPI